MSKKAYFLVSMKEEFCRNGRYQEAIRELATIPEVKSIEVVDGVCDLILTVEVPIKAIYIADKVLPMEWVKRITILKVQSPEPESYYDRARTLELVRHGTALAHA